MALVKKAIVTAELLGTDLTKLKNIIEPLWGATQLGRISSISIDRGIDEQGQTHWYITIGGKKVVAEAALEPGETAEKE